MSIHNSRQAGAVSTFLFAFLFLPLQVSAICYYPDGTVTPGDVPCLTGNDPSFCCSFGYACLNNQICMTTAHTPNATNTYVRGSCTDPTWRSANCPSFCVNPDPPWQDDTGGGEGMALCPKTTNTFYCVDFNEDAVDCAERVNIAVEAAGTPVALTTIGFSSSTTPTSSSTTSSSSPSSQSPSAAQTSARTPTSSSATAEQTSVRTPTSSMVPTAPASLHHPVSESTIVGSVVGSIAGLLVIGLLAFFIFHRRRRARRQAPPMDSHQASWSHVPAVHSHSELPHSPMKYRAAYEPRWQPWELDGRRAVQELPAGSPTVY